MDVIHRSIIEQQIEHHPGVIAELGVVDQNVEIWDGFGWIVHHRVKMPHQIEKVRFIEFAQALIMQHVFFHSLSLIILHQLGKPVFKEIYRFHHFVVGVNSASHICSGRRVLSKCQRERNHCQRQQQIQFDEFFHNPARLNRPMLSILPVISRIQDAAGVCILNLKLDQGKYVRIDLHIHHEVESCDNYY